MGTVGIPECRPSRLVDDMHTEGNVPFFSPLQKVTAPDVVELVQHPRLVSTTMHRNWIVDVYLPIGYRQNLTQSYPWLIANDGQDMKAVNLRATLQQLQRDGLMEPTIVIAIHAPHDRRQVYGIAAEADFKQRGALASAYSLFLKDEIIPYLMKEYRAKRETGAIMGFSLGGLQAFDMAWHHPDLFAKVGVFSGSFWWRRKAYEEGYQDHDRIMLDLVARGHRQPLKFWLQVGTHDENADRDQDGLIDAVGDSRDLVRLLTAKGYDFWNDIRYLEIPNGHHNQTTWAEVLPDFLQWAFGSSKSQYAWGHQAMTN